MAIDELNVEVAYSPAPGQVTCLTIRVPAGCTVGEALDRSGLLAAHPELGGGVLSVGVWGALRDLGDALRDRDRVEVYRPLRVDPKEARRQRQRTQGLRGKRK